MQRTRLSWILVSIVLAWTSTALSQQQTPNTAIVPRLIRFAGTLKDSAGKPLSGPVGITFTLYKEQQGGAALWIETQNVSLDSAGRYSVLLGATKPEGIPTELFTSGEAQWLGVEVSGQSELPRVLLVSVPYALKAADAETLGGKPPSAFVSAPANGSTLPPPAGTVTSVGLSAPITDYTVTGSPVTTAGTLNFAWKVPPSNVNTANAIVKRDASGNFSAGTVTATAVNAGTLSGSGTAITNVNAASLGGVAPGGYANLGLADTFTQPLTLKAAASTTPLLSVQGTGTGAGSFTVDGFGNVTVSPGSGANALNLVPGVSLVTNSSNWSNFSAINLIPGSALFPVNSARTVLYVGFTNGSQAVISNMVVYTTSRGSTKIKAVTPVKLKGVSNPSISLTNTANCPVQPVSTTNPCIVRLDPAALTLSSLNDYYFVIFFPTNANNSALSVATPSSTNFGLVGGFVSGDSSRLTVGQSVPVVTSQPQALMSVRSN